MSFSLAQFLLSQTKQHNGHLQCEMAGLSVEDGIEICKELEELFDNKSSFTVQLWTTGGFTIYQMDYWENLEHPLGHTDRMILSVSNP